MDGMWGYSFFFWTKDLLSVKLTDSSVVHQILLDKFYTVLWLKVFLVCLSLWKSLDK